MNFTYYDILKDARDHFLQMKTNALLEFLVKNELGEKTVHEIDEDFFYNLARAKGVGRKTLESYYESAKRLGIKVPNQPVRIEVHVHKAIVKIENKKPKFWCSECNKELVPMGWRLKTKERERDENILRQIK